MAKKRTKKVSANYFESVPVRSEDRPWRVTEDGMVEVDVENKGFYNTIAQKLFRKPRISHIALDAHGSAIWQNIDGKNTVMDIIKIMERDFPNDDGRMLDRVVTFLATLQTNGFITVPKTKKKGAKS